MVFAPSLDPLTAEQRWTKAHVKAGKNPSIPGWWFGTWILFFLILGIIIPTDFHIFQRGWLNHQAGGWVVKWVMFGESVLGDCVMIKLDETKPVCGVHPGKWAITSRHTRLAVGSNIKKRCIQHFSVRVCLNMLGSPGNFSWSLLPSGNLLHSYWKWPSRNSGFSH